MTETIEEKIAKLEAEKKVIEEKIAECQEALEKRKKSKLAIPFVPKKGEEYWLYAGGCCYSAKNESSRRDIERIREGNSFRTEKEIRLACEKRVAETELLRMCDGFDLKEKTNFVPYLYEGKGWRVEAWYHYMVCPYRFASRASCQAAIDKLGDRKLKLVFNIPLEN